MVESHRLDRGNTSKHIMYIAKTMGCQIVAKETVVPVTTYTSNAAPTSVNTIITIALSAASCRAAPSIIMFAVLDISILMPHVPPMLVTEISE
jgi:hypothetical protein